MGAGPRTPDPGPLRQRRFRRGVALAVLFALAVAYQAGAQEILLDQMVQCGELKCYPVQGDPTTWYYLPDQPHLVMDADGNPQFSYLMYVTPEHKGEGGIAKAPGGGIAHFLVAYDVPQDQVRRAQSDLARKKPGAQLQGPVSYSEGTFALVTALNDPQAGLSRRVVGVGNAPVMAGHKAAVSMHLTPEGASILWESFKQRTPDISVNFEMTVSGYRNPVEAAMAIDWERANQTMQVQAAGRLSFIAIEVDVLLQKMRDNGSIKVELKGVPPSQWQSIQELALDLAREQLFDNLGAAALESMGAAGQQSPLDRLWKAYGSEWQQQGRGGQTSWLLDQPPASWLVAEAGWPRRVAWRSGGVLLAAPHPPATPPPSVRTAADRAAFLANEALIQIDAGHWDEAISLYEEAQRLDYSRAGLWALAHAQVMAGRRGPALSSLDRYLSGEPGLRDYGPMQGARESIAQAPATIPADSREILQESLSEARHMWEQAGRPGPSPTETAGRTQELGETSSFVEGGEVGPPAGEGRATRPEPEPVATPRSTASAGCEEAARLFDRALALVDREQYRDAARVFEQAQAICSHPRVLFNLALCHLMLGQRGPALESLDRAIAESPGWSQDEAMQAARRALSEAPATIPRAERWPLSTQIGDAYAALRNRASAGGAATSPSEGATAEPEAGGTPAAATPSPGSQPTRERSAIPSPFTAAAARTPSAAATRTPAAAAGRTPAAAAAGRTPTPAAGAGRTPTPAATAAARGQQQTRSGIIASFRYRKVERKGAFTFNLKQWIRTEIPVRFAANIGDLSPLMSNPRYFRRVNLDDPVFKQREIPVTVDVQGEEAFAAMLNSVTVTLRKVHQSGKETLDEATISRHEFSSGTPPTLVYGWDQDDNRTRWLDYDIRVRWSYAGGPVIETAWQRTSAGALVLEPPLRPRALLLLSDPDFLREQGVRDVLAEIAYRAGSITRTATATVRSTAGTVETRLIIYQDPQAPAYTTTLTWRLAGGQRVVAGPTEEKADVIYLDELPR
ncbi:MAG: hypothetical protein V1750_08730 [Acidobacteriota bacterium]